MTDQRRSEFPHIRLLNLGTVKSAPHDRRSWEPRAFHTLPNPRVSIFLTVWCRLAYPRRQAGCAHSGRSPRTSPARSRMRRLKRLRTPSPCSRYRTSINCSTKASTARSWSFRHLVLHVCGRFRWITKMTDRPAPASYPGAGRSANFQSSRVHKRSKTRPCGGAKVGHFGSVRSLSP